MDISVASSPTVMHNKVDLVNESLKPTMVFTELKQNTIVLNSEQRTEKSTADESSPNKLDEVAAELSDMMSMMRKGLAFKVDEHSGQAVVSVLDRDTGDVIRQMPSEEALALAEKLSEVTGLLMKTEA
ncbi:flagellar protein FlaG [Shewanella morhuae]|uniref:Flagellar protein FlaG n=1 Tax=Shewanella morhuae TaxID=365591 RepID=A0A380A7U7_9GAMM|nr:flagellar protein FlaG [Shewanella morhuae]SUI75711.1 flagellar protein FlaG [Shewanella morhuae]